MELSLIMNEHFQNETICFDGFAFKNCIFTDCVILITCMDFEFKNCTFFGSTLHIEPSLPIFEISHQLSQSLYDDSTHCYRDDYQYPQTALPLPAR